MCCCAAAVRRRIWVDGGYAQHSAVLKAAACLPPPSPQTATCQPPVPAQAAAAARAGAALVPAIVACSRRRQVAGGRRSGTPARRAPHCGPTLPRGAGSRRAAHCAALLCRCRPGAAHWCRGLSFKFTATFDAVHSLLQRSPLSVHALRSTLLGPARRGPAMTLTAVESLAVTLGKAPHEAPLIPGSKEWVRAREGRRPTLPAPGSCSRPWRSEEAAKTPALLVRGPAPGGGGRGALARKNAHSSAAPGAPLGPRVRGQQRPAAPPRSAPWPAPRPTGCARGSTLAPQPRPAPRAAPRQTPCAPPQPTGPPCARGRRRREGRRHARRVGAARPPHRAADGAPPPQLRAAHGGPHGRRLCHAARAALCAQPRRGAEARVGQPQVRA